jgi:sulfocyanin
MKRLSTLSLVVAFAACGGGEPAENASSAAAETAAPAAPAATEAATPSGEMTMPDWMQVDEANKTVHLTVTAGLTDAKNYWNFNGGHDGNMTITVPEGFTVTIDLVNKDPNMAHSLGIVSQTSGFGAMPEATPVFDGAITEDAGSMTDATMPGETETVQFMAATAGNYSMICFIPGHAATGMYVHFNVSADGHAGVQGSM